MSTSAGNVDFGLSLVFDLRGSVGFFSRGILRPSSIILNSPFEYDVILTFVRAHGELVYFFRS